MPQDMSTMAMNPYFAALNYPVARDTMMVMLLSDFQSARTTSDFVTAMGMVQYGLTARWTMGFMVEGQRISGSPVTYGGLRVNSSFRVFPHDHLLNFTVYGEYEGLNGAALYKMEVAGFGGGDLNEPLASARHTPVRTVELRAISYHDWGRVNLTFNFINETGLDSGENDFGYAWGVFRQPAYSGMETDTDMAGMAGIGPPASRRHVDSLASAIHSCCGWESDTRSTTFYIDAHRPRELPRGAGYPPSSETVPNMTALSMRPADDGLEAGAYDNEQSRSGDLGRLRSRIEFRGSRPRRTGASGVSARDHSANEASVRIGRQVPGHDGRQRKNDGGDEGRRSVTRRSRRQDEAARRIEKADATADVVGEMVTQRESMRDGMTAMPQEMMGHMTEHVQTGTDSLPTQPWSSSGRSSSSCWSFWSSVAAG